MATLRLQAFYIFDLSNNINRAVVEMGLHRRGSKKGVEVNDTLKRHNLLLMGANMYVGFFCQSYCSIKSFRNTNF